MTSENPEAEKKEIEEAEYHQTHKNAISVQEQLGLGL